VQISPTGGVWTQEPTGTSNELKGIALGNNVYVAVGTNGVILTSPVALPVISKQPASVSAKVGQTVMFSVKAKGSGALTYQWLKGTANVKDNARISGATKAKLTIAKAVKGDGAAYQVRITDTFGSVLSTKAMLTVK
jgi:hypothetical protein